MQPGEVGQYGPAGQRAARAPLRGCVQPVLRHGMGVVQPGGERAPASFVPFTLPGETVEAVPVGHGDDWAGLRVLTPSPERVEPGCPHFGVCGGCQLQMASAPEQLRIKQAVLLDWLARAGVGTLPELQVHAAQPWGYRNRIRLRVGRDTAGALRFGYNERASRRFLPVGTCPISAPLLWRAAEAVLAVSARSAEWSAWMRAAAEVEFFADETLQRVQVLFLLNAVPPGKPDLTFPRAMEALLPVLPEVVGAGAMLLGPQQRHRERTRRPVASWGAAGLAYTVDEERYWVTRGGFFQVNRFLLPELVRLVCGGRAGSLAWDLYAGVGLFSRMLARSFTQITAVEGDPTAAGDLQLSLSQLGKAHVALPASTYDFLRGAVVQRARPELLVLDPPRAGAGPEVCQLLLQLDALEVVYVSCDPETLARDLAVLKSNYRIAALHLVDMFPQTYHQETVVVLRRTA